MGKKKNGFHTGQFVKDELERHDKVFASVARKASISPQNLTKVFRRPSIDDALLGRLSEASGLDLIGMVSRERSRSLRIYREPEESHANAAEPLAERPDQPFKFVITVDPNDDQMWKKMQQIREILRK